MEQTIKRIFIAEPEPKTKSKSKQVDGNKLVDCTKEKKTRVEATIWELVADDLTHSTQVQILNYLKNNLKTDAGPYANKYVSHIKSKICSYKNQDIKKNRLDLGKLITYDETLDLLSSSGLRCHYCADEVYILYEKVRENKQWSLDRINNDIGHNSGNLVIACLECNLKRRRTNKDSFMFTKNMVICREGYIQNEGEDGEDGDKEDKEDQ